jgi:hypothetical protein
MFVAIEGHVYINFTCFTTFACFAWFASVKQASFHPSSLRHIDYAISRSIKALSYAGRWAMNVSLRDSVALASHYQLWRDSQ